MRLFTEGLRRLPLRRGDGRLEAPISRSSSRLCSAPASATDSPTATKTRSGSMTPCRPGARTPTCHMRSPASRGKISLVILSNAMNEQISSQRRRSCRRRFTRSTPRRMRGACKPRLQAFESCSSSLACTRGRPARVRQPAPRHLPGPEPGIVNKVFVNRGHGAPPRRSVELCGDSRHQRVALPSWGCNAPHRFKASKTFSASKLFLQGQA